MPLYTYHCTKCDRKETRIVSITQRDEQVCDAQTEGNIPCETHLVREEIELIARMTESWRP